MKPRSKYVLICLLLTHCLSAQTLADFKYLNYPYVNEWYVGIGISRSSISNPAAPFPERHRLNAISGTIELKKSAFDKGEMRYYGQHKLLPDMLVLTKQAIEINTNALNRDENSYLANGIFGWHSFTWNLHSPSKYSLALGINLNDYFLGSTYYTDTVPNHWVSPEPQGYYFAAGPSLQANYMLGKYFMAELLATYSISYWRAVSLSYATVNNKYPKPHFAQLHAELFSTWGLFAGIDYNFIINRGDIPNSTQRLDLSLGFRFMMDSDPN
ncbi:MAG: hypothetical protein ACKOXB_14710 [Flavobacteriales bacterium]